MERQVCQTERHFMDIQRRLVVFAKNATTRRNNVKCSSSAIKYLSHAVEQNKANFIFF